LIASFCCRPSVSRRHALAVLGSLAVDACGGSLGGHGANAGEELKLDRAIDLVPAAHLAWLVEMTPRDLLAGPVFGPAVAMLVPAPRFDAFARRRGGLDLRRAEELVVAGYPEATLVVARVPFEPERVEAAFAALGGAAEGRAVEHGVTRMWRSVQGGHEQVALLAGRAVVFERGQLGPLRAAVYFAEGRLRRSLPALGAEPLASAAALAGEAPLRAFAPGPFEGEWARGLAGLLRATTAIAFTLRPAANAPNSAVSVRMLLMGAWGQDASAAAERLRSAFGVLMVDPLGRLTGIDHPLEGPTVTADAGALTLEVTLDALAAARGFHTMGDANVAEIMAY
jgi:hypothetical protein